MELERVVMVRTFPNCETTHAPSVKCNHRTAACENAAFGAADLCHPAVVQAVLQLQLVHAGGAQRPETQRHHAFNRTHHSCF